MCINISIHSYIHTFIHIIHHYPTRSGSPHPATRLRCVRRCRSPWRCEGGNPHLSWRVTLQRCTNGSNGSGSIGKLTVFSGFFWFLDESWCLSMVVCKWFCLVIPFQSISWQSNVLLYISMDFSVDPPARTAAHMG